jgi:alpha-L-fucosidase
VKFDARAWVRLAREAGMKYLVITSKHHDGFALFHSRADRYNVVDATPWGRDPMKALARECRRAGIRLCFYYSQDQDWHHPGGSGNTWDYPNRTPDDFARYLEVKVKPQVRELLSNYGPIGLIWFDTPFTISREQSEDLARLVHELQPDCLVSGRVGHDVGDYGSLGDNQIPAGRVSGAWETPATLNDTWGYKTDDKHWKTTRDLLFLLVDLASKGVNYLLNVGPTARGVIPAASVKRLREMGRWLRTNGEAIHGADPSPFPCEVEGVRITAREGRLYLLFTRWPGRRFVLRGLFSTVLGARVLRTGKPLKFVQSVDGRTGVHALALSLPSRAPDRPVATVVLDVEGIPQADPLPLQQTDGRIELYPFMARIHGRERAERLGISPNGSTCRWTAKSDWLSWEFRVAEPGEFEVRVVTSLQRRQREWVGGHRVAVTIGRERVAGRIREDETRDTPRAQYFPEKVTRLGRVRLPRAGLVRGAIRLEKLNPKATTGLVLTSVELSPAPNAK